MNFIVRRSVAWTTLNLLGMAVFLRLASEIWVLPGEGDCLSRHSETSVGTKNQDACLCLGNHSDTLGDGFQI